MTNEVWKPITAMPDEVWKPIAGYEGMYEISSYGRVRSLARTIAIEGDVKGAHVRSYRERILRYARHPGGYQTVVLSNTGEQIGHYVHRLVAEAFLPPRPEAPEVNHKDADKTNNHVSNLEWVTAAENGAHASKAGLCAKKLTPEKVAEIRRLRETGLPYSKIAAPFGVSKRLVMLICRGDIWKNHGVT